MIEPEQRLPEEVDTAKLGGSDKKAPRPVNRWVATRKAWPFVAATLLMLTFVTFPSAPRELDMDPSLSVVLNHAHRQDLQFGSEIVNTYGPLGYLIFSYFWLQGAATRMCMDVALCWTVALGIVLLAARLRPLGRWALVLGFIWAAANMDGRVDLVFEVGLVCWGLLCFAEAGPRLALYITVYTALAIFAALAKNSFLLIGGASMLLIFADLLVRGRRRLAFGILGGFGAGMVLLWLAAGQELSHLPGFLAKALVMAQAYNAALGWDAPSVVDRGAFILLPLLAGAVLLRVLAAFEDAPVRWFRRGCVLAWAALLTFATWKHSFVRSDLLHARFFFGFAPVLALAMGCLRSDSGRFVLSLRLGPWAGVVAALCWLVSYLTLQTWVFAPGVSSVTQPFRAFVYNAHCLLDPLDYQQRMTEVLEENRAVAQLPRLRQIIGPCSVDIFGQRQTYAYFNDLVYRPRPVCQSYVACDARLMRLNEEFYRSSAAPEYVLFLLEPLDLKFPTLEDAWALRTLLANYELVGVEHGFLLLKRNSFEAPKLELVREGTVHPGERIDLGPYAGTDLWLEVEVLPGLQGKAREFLYRPATVRLAAWSDSGKKLLLRKRAPPAMLKAGFLASPLLANNDDVFKLCTGQDQIRPAAYSVEFGPGQEGYWRQTIRFRLFKLPKRLGGEDFEQAAALSNLNSAARSNLVASILSQRAAVRPFTLSRNANWRPTRPPAGGLGENLALVFFLLLACFFATTLAALAFYLRHRKLPAGWRLLLAGNLLVLLFLVSAGLCAGEIYFRFIYDTTDSLGFTKTCERWVQRHWQVNAAGCRDDVQYLPRIAAGKRRVTFVGDSFTAGHGIAGVQDRFANRLRLARPDWEVHVLAKVGLDTGGETDLLKKALEKGYQLDQVVLVYCLNDIGELVPSEGLGLEKIFTDLDQSGFLMRNSFLCNFLYFRYKAARTPELVNYFSFVRQAYQGPVWEQQKLRLKAFRDLVQAHGGRLSVMTFPFLHALGPAYEYQFVHDELGTLWHELQVPHLDLLPVYQDQPVQKLVVNRFDAHPNEYANRLAAAALEKFLSPTPDRRSQSRRDDKFVDR